MKGLSREARATLKEAGIKPSQWGELHFDDAVVWHGDACGCSDDRCAGFHHEAWQPCGCLPAMLEVRARSIRH